MKIRQWLCENRRQVIAGTLMAVCIKGGIRTSV